MKCYTIVLLLLFSTFLLSCGSSYKILKAEKEDSFKLADYTTFGFFDIEAQGDTVSENFEKRIDLVKKAISQNLQSRGLDEARDPGLKINIATSVKEEIQTRQTDFRTEGLPRYMGQRRYSWKSEEVPVGRYREGTLIIDIVDAANNKMVWQGGVEGIIPEKSQNFEQDINKAIADIVARIP